MSRTVTGGSPPTSPTRSGMCRPTGGALRHRARDCAAGAGSPRRGRCVRRGWRVVAPGLADLPPIWDPGLAGGGRPARRRGADRSDRGRLGARGGAGLVLPGNAGNRSLRAPLAILLAGAGLDVLLVDYRGFGDNPGRPSREGLLADARAARVALRERSAADAVVYYGESLGGAVTVALAGEQAPDALVLRSPFTSLTDVGRLHYPFLPVALLRDRFAVEEDIRSYAGPVLVVAGERDRIIPPAQSRRVAEAAPGSAKYVEVPGADHNDAALLAGDRLIEAVVTFLARVGIDAAL